MKYLFVIWCIFLISGGVSTVDYSQVLHDLSGHWVGTGFTMIAVPAKITNNPRDFDLKLFHTCESIVFSGVREHIRNAGDDEETFLKALTYLQQVSDHTTSTELHIEPGIWFFQPADDLATQPQELFRAGNIAHGNSFIAGSTKVTDYKKGGPTFEAGFNTIPFPFGEDDDPTARLSGDYVDQYVNDPDATTRTAIPLPQSMEEKYGDIECLVTNPTLFLTRDNTVSVGAGQKILSTREIDISSVETGPSLGGVLNIPMLSPGLAANVSQVEARYYIEKVQDTDGVSIFYQLQYVQEVYINFPVFKTNPPLITWPHVSVATLRKISGEYVS